VCLFRLFSRCNEVSNFFWSYLSRGGVDRPKNMSRIINSVHVKSFPIIIDSVHVKSFPVRSHPPNSCAFVFRQNFREGRQKRTAYFAPVGPSTPVLVPGIQWGDYSNSGIHLRYVTTVFNIRASQGLSTGVLQSWRKLPPPPQNTPAVVGNFKKMSISVGFCVSFRNTTVGPVGPVQKETQTPDRK